MDEIELQDESTQSNELQNEQSNYNEDQITTRSNLMKEETKEEEINKEAETETEKEKEKEKEREEEEEEEEEEEDEEKNKILFSSYEFSKEHFPEDVFGQPFQDGIVYFGKKESLDLFHQVLNWKNNNPSSTLLDALKHFCDIYKRKDSLVFFLKKKKKNQKIKTEKFHY